MRRHHLAAIAVCIVIWGIARMACAVELTLSPSSSSVSRDTDLTVDINIDDATGIAGCTFTLEYPSAILALADMAVTTDFFKPVFDNKSGADPSSTYPWEKNITLPGEIKLSGAYISMDPVSGGGGAYTGSQTLFSVHFKVKADAPLGNFSLKLKQTELCNELAGWGTDANNNGKFDTGDIVEGAPILIKAYGKGTSQWGTPNEFEIILTNFTTVPIAGLEVLSEPEVNSPTNIDVPATDDDGSYTISWGASITSGVTYILEEASDSGFVAGLRTAYTGSSTSTSITGRGNGVTYYYRVKATRIGYADSTWLTASTGCAVAEEIAAIIPDTGQTTSYTDTYGEDSDYTVNPPSYTKLDATGNALSDSVITWAMIRDNVTGLIWENKTDDSGIHDKDNTYTWQTAEDDFIAQLNYENFGGRSDWRLPTAKELTTLVDREKHSPSIQTGYFTKTMPSGYWSSTVGTGYSDSAWSVSFFVGTVQGHSKSNPLYVRAVCGEPSGVFADAIIPERMVDNGDQTLSDTASGLMWQKEEANAKTWEAALTYCETLELAGYDDWRLPNINELQTLVDYSQNDPATDTVMFPGALSSGYWSATSLDSFPGAAWSVHFSYGLVGYYGKSNNLNVRAVRGGQ